MFDTLLVQSHKGTYQANFQKEISFDHFENELLNTSHFIIDKKIAELYSKKLEKILKTQLVLLIEAVEKNKSFEKFPSYVEHLVKNKIRRNHRLVAIGGGIIQDITCFLAATILRGVDWWFYPTTLLAQADSCIGSKSSVNCNGVKNILGTFTPPRQIFIFSEFLETLNAVDVQSGVGEMLKAHAIESVGAFDQIAKEYEQLFTDQKILLQYLRRSLKIKQKIIEQDEFDWHIRNVMNYGHTFGHAIESATQYQIPHGVAVTIGMDMANYIACEYHFSDSFYFNRTHPILKKNYQSFIHYDIPFEHFIAAISKDKKNSDKNDIIALLPDKESRIVKACLQNNNFFQEKCRYYLRSGRLL